MKWAIAARPPRFLIDECRRGFRPPSKFVAAHGEAAICQGPRRVRLVAVPPEQRAPILREYVRVALSGRQHFPLLAIGVPPSDVEAIAERHPVCRIDPA